MISKYKPFRKCDNKEHISYSNDHIIDECGRASLVARRGEARGGVPSQVDAIMQIIC